jgi:predicted nucleotidyltransferase
MAVITEESKSRIRALAEKYHLSLVALFVSQATGKTHKESDVDIAYLPGRPLSMEEEININYELTLIFRTDRVDTVNLRSAPGLLLKQIADQGMVFYEKTGMEFAELEIYAMRRYKEAAPLFEIRREKLDAFLKPA